MTQAAETQGRPPVTLTPEQLAAKETILTWWDEHGKKGKGGLIRLGGYAGTGKTTLLGDLVVALKAKGNPSIAFCAITGKASNVLRSKLTLDDDDYCGTIHALIYRPIVENGFIKGWTRADAVPHDLFIVDEASMVNENVLRDLERFKLPIIAVGDHGQLPPVDGDFNLMGKPDLKLETIHRQAEDNPIIRLSIQARKSGRIDAGVYGQGVRKIVTPNLFQTLRETFDKDALYLCGFNATRVMLNKFYRETIGVRSASPIKGDRVVCLRNNRTAGIWNGMTGVLRAIKPDGKDFYSVEIDMDGGDRYAGRISRFQFGQATTPQNWNVGKMGDLFDFAYCLTVHKAQGSEAEKVILIEQRSPNMEDFLYAKWLYTGITRARKELTIIRQV